MSYRPKRILYLLKWSEEMKFNVEYKRTVRIRPYETMSIGILEEFDKGKTSPFDAFEAVKNQVDYLIDLECKRLRAS